MKCQILFSGKNKKNISKCRLLKILPRVLSVKRMLSLFDHLSVLFKIIHNTHYYGTTLIYISFFFLGK